MNVPEWVGVIVGGITIAGSCGFLFSGWKDGRAIKQALLGFEGNGGMMLEVQELRADVTALRQQLTRMDRDLREEIATSRHDLRAEFTLKLTQVEGRLMGEIDKLDGRVRDCETRTA